jgi:hypothetical protein
MSNKWIKCGLPWTFYGDYKDAPKSPDLKKETKKEFGKSIEQAYKELENTLGGAKYSSPEYNEIVKSKEYKAAQRKYKKFADKVRDWMKDQPAWIAYLDAIKTYHYGEDQKSFCGRQLNKPGTIIEVLIGKELKQLLIGDINILGGVCDDCMGFGRDVVVVRYKNGC